MPGDSPMGARLPLEALTWQPPPPSDPDPSSFDDRSPLPDRETQRARRRDDARAVEPHKLPRSTLCVEVRAGNLYVFLPPVPRLEHAVDLLGVVEEAAAALGRPIVLEGYLPPIDPRIARLAITPDPGVLEVNVQPASSWPELVDITTGVHADARATRLGTETFHLDGTHAGTGGGNHLTLGGPTPADSPILRRPDLLRSIITFWQHHPSLSYFFSGRFIGPTSQAPRVDEARHESLYELEIAFGELERRRGDNRWPGVAVAGRPLVPAPARRRHRQHAPRRAVHRQAVQPGFRAGPARAARAAWLRDATASANGARSSVARARARRALRRRALRRPARAMGHRPPRPLPASVLRGRRHCRSRRRPRRARNRLRRRVARTVLRVPIPAYRLDRRERRHPRAARGDRAVVGARRGSHVHRNFALRRFVGRAHAGEGRRAHVRASHRDLQRCAGAAAPDRRDRRLRRGRAVQGLEAAVGTAPDDRGPRPARVRHRRPVERAITRGLHLSRDPPRRTHLRPLPRQRERGRSAPRQPVLRGRTHAGPDRRARARSPRARRIGRRARRPGVPSDARPSAHRVSRENPGPRAS